MEKFVFNRSQRVPSNRLADVTELRRFIVDEMGIEISLTDTHLLWEAVSASWDAGWLSIDTHYENESREEFLRYQMEKFGVIIED